MNSLKNTTFRLSSQILLLLFLYFICRVIFIIKYSTALNFSGFKEVLEVFIGGMRFDLSAIFASNLLYIFLALLPFNFTQTKLYSINLKSVFIIVNGICLLMNLADIAYFSFVQKRMQFDVLGFVNGDKGNDLFNLLPGFVLEYWYIVISFIGIIILLVQGYNRSLKFKVEKVSVPIYLYRSILLIFFVGASIIFIRGGLQLKPLNIIHASQMTSVKNIPAILNSPFSIIKTMNKKGLKRLNYFSEEEMKGVGVHEVYTSQISNKKNVVIIIVESLSKNNVGYFNGKAQTPFLDSIFSNSAVFVNAFANARESVQGIPAIISAIPSWQDEPFIFSSYSTNKISSLPTLLKQQGYSSSFFHGGTNGTMGFNAFSSLAGFDNYYGRNEYNNEDDFDGNWGIWDEPFLKFVADKLSDSKQPFMSAVFTLNPHHPFKIPLKYSDGLKQEGHPFYTSLRYTDFALSQFFSTIKNEPWFKNTLFVITADHTAPVIESSKSNYMEDHRIPVVFYLPDNSLQGKNEKIANQIDILPSVLQLLGFNQRYFSFGNNLFKNVDHGSSLFYNSGVYNYVDDSILYQFNGQKALAIYNWRSDSNLHNNLIERFNNQSLKIYANLTKKKLQLFNNNLIENKMFIK